MERKESDCYCIRFDSLEDLLSWCGRNREGLANWDRSEERTSAWKSVSDLEKAASLTWFADGKGVRIRVYDGYIPEGDEQVIYRIMQTDRKDKAEPMQVKYARTEAEAYSWLMEMYHMPDRYSFEIEEILMYGGHQRIYVNRSGEIPGYNHGILLDDYGYTYGIYYTDMEPFAFDAIHFSQKFFDSSLASAHIFCVMRELQNAAYDLSFSPENLDQSYMTYKDDPMCFEYRLPVELKRDGVKLHIVADMEGEWDDEEHVSFRWTEGPVWVDLL